MTNDPIKVDTRFSIFAWFIFVLLFVYLFLRAWYVEPIHDEVATYFNFIETGLIWGDKALLDANNHFINSYLSHFLYTLFGMDFFWLRLPNVLSFGLFFWSSYQLVKPINKVLFRGITLLALTGIPFVLEYFAYTRGYGISLAFFLATLVFLKRFSSTYSIQNLFATYLFLSIAVYANLTFLVSAILTILYVSILQFLVWKEIRWKKQILFLVLSGCLFWAILPAIHHAEKLKEAGALYYGSLAGFWEVTGKTLTENTLFNHANWLKWMLIFAGSTMIFSLLFIWIKNGTRAFFKRKETPIAWFLFGNITVILFLAHFRNVNYPQDRVGMYLIPLTLLLFAYLINNWKPTSYLTLILLIFPFVCIPRINLSTSVFSPGDRMSNEFYADVIQYVQPNSTISAHPLMCLTWAQHNRKQNSKNSVTSYNLFNTASDFILTKDYIAYSPKILKDYEEISRATNSDLIAYKRKVPFVKTVVFDTTFSIASLDAEFIGFCNFIIPDSLRNKKLQIHVEGDFRTDSPYTTTHFVYSTLDDKFNAVVYDSWNQRWSQGAQQHFFMNYNFPIDEYQDKEKEVRVYLWNIDKEKITIKNCKFELLILE